MYIEKKPQDFTLLHHLVPIRNDESSAQQVRHQQQQQVQNCVLVRCSRLVPTTGNEILGVVGIGVGVTTAARRFGDRTVCIVLDEDLVDPADPTPRAKEAPEKETIKPA